MRTDAELLAESIALTRGMILVVTGAGVSLASGIPTFRGTDPDAVWTRDVTELGTFSYFQEDPAGSWRWYMSRFDKVLCAEPNAAHLALVALERWQLERGGGFLLVTQNVDVLHAKAGSQELVEVHGRADRIRCARDGCTHGAPRGWLPREDFDMGSFRADPIVENLPRCPECGELLRQHVLWFDEYYHQHADYQFGRVQLAATQCELTVFMGTSLSVGVTELVLRASLQRGKEVISIDPGAGPARLPITQLGAKVEEILPETLRLLGS